MSDTTAPRHARFFSAARPFDSTKDDCLLDAMQQTIEVCQDCGIRGGFTIMADGEGVIVTRPGDDVFRGATVREALAAAFDAE